MKVVHINTSNKGGAGIAALRLHERLLSAGVDSSFLSLYSFPSDVKGQVQFKRRDCTAFPLIADITEFGVRVLKKLGLRQPYPQALEAKHLAGRPENLELFSLPFSSFRIEEHPLVKQADVVHLHWVSDGFLDFQSFFQSANKKIVWTLHDMFPFTGGCHHADGCNLFSDSCEVCPQLSGTIDPKYAAAMLKVKKSGLSTVSPKQMNIVCPSLWLTRLSSGSSLFKQFKHSTIANPVNGNVFSFKARSEARRRLSIPQEKKVVLFVAHSIGNVRKGGGLLYEALKLLGNDSNLLLCSVGSDAEAISYPLTHVPFGYVNSEERMSDLYSAADVFVLPSMAENFPNTICESLLCGTPVVGFRVGGITELVNDTNGKLADPFNTQQLASAILFVLDNEDQFNREQISESAHSRLNPELSTGSYIEVYNELINANA